MAFFKCFKNKKIIFLIFLSKTEIKLKNEIFSIFVSVRLTKKNNKFIIFLLSQEISQWVNPRRTPYMYRGNFFYGVFSVNKVIIIINMYEIVKF